jgi:hypothetical protein
MGVLTEKEEKLISELERGQRTDAYGLAALVRRLAARREELEEFRDSLLDRVCEDCTTQGCPHHTSPSTTTEASKSRVEALPICEAPDCNRQVWLDATFPFCARHAAPTSSEPQDRISQREKLVGSIGALKSTPSTHPADVSKKAGEIDMSCLHYWAAPEGRPEHATCMHCGVRMSALHVVASEEER